MAQRQILRRLWSARPLFTGLLHHSPHYHAALTTKTVYPLVSNLQKSFSTTAQKNVTFNVQDEADFEERVKKSEIPVIVDFHATWCGPCKILAPRLEKLVAEQEGKVMVAKVDIDEHQDLAIKHGVQAVPTVISFKNGSVVEKFVGVKDEDQLGSFIAKLL